MAKHYSIDEEKKVIYADILSLTEKEEAEVEKFVKFGFTVENKVENKVKIDRLNDEYITEYLKGDKEALKIYTNKKNEVATDENGNIKTTTRGKKRTRGFNAGRNWFSREYPKDIAEVDKKIAEAGLTKKFNEAYKQYENKNKDNDDIMTEAQYKRDYYWKKVFVRE